MTMYSTGIEGLDLVLGGGIRAVARAGEESTALLVRGAPGTGKTVLGAHVASALARGRQCDVAYACVELLPVELKAQLEGFRGEHAPLPVTPLHAGGRMASGDSQIFAAMLDLEPGQEVDSLGHALVALLGAIEEAGGKPRVLVLDCLSDGYGLGSAVPRVVVDSVCKFAADRGLFLVLLEEALDSRPSSWCFAVDIVLELTQGMRSAPSDGDAFHERHLLVQKNRFSRGEIGPHTLVFDNGVHLWPTPATWIWANANLPRQEPLDLVWPPGTPPTWPRLSHSVVAIFGPELGPLRHAAFSLGSRDGAGPAKGTDLLLDLGRQIGIVAGHSPDNQPLNSLPGHPLMSAGELLARAFAMAKKLLGSGKLRKIIIGDCRALRSYSDARAILQGLALFSDSMRAHGIPVVLFETSEPEREMAVINQQHPLSWSWYRNIPSIVDFAQVIVEDRHDKGFRATSTGSSQSVVWTSEAFSS